jgi:hypothetical protein
MISMIKFLLLLALTAAPRLAASHAPAVGPSSGSPFRFSHHFIDTDLPGSAYGLAALVDIDGDGDLDFVTGGRALDRTIFWFEYRAPDDWVRHVLGTHHPSDVGGAAHDIDGDGWIDFVAGGAWYRNPGNPRKAQFERHVFDPGLSHVHDLVIADVTGDGRVEVLTMSDRNNLRYYRIPADPFQSWIRVDVGPGVHAGTAVGDLDGDGDLDIVRSNVWFENADGQGTRWIEHPLPFGDRRPPYPYATRCVVADINQNGHNDLVMTDGEIAGGRIAWLENVDGTGQNWRVHPLPKGDEAVRGAYHSLAVADFNNDGALDIFTVEMEWIRGERQPRWFIWENVDGRGAHFVERVILDKGLGGHEAVVGDVTGNGAPDICSKLWRPRPDNANEGRNHADFLRNEHLNQALGRTLEGP